MRLRRERAAAASGREEDDGEVMAEVKDAQAWTTVGHGGGGGSRLAGCRRILGCRVRALQETCLVKLAKGAGG